jgi:hypothetical protein
MPHNPSHQSTTQRRRATADAGVKTDVFGEPLKDQSAATSLAEAESRLDPLTGEPKRFSRRVSQDDEANHLRNILRTDEAPDKSQIRAEKFSAAQANIDFIRSQFNRIIGREQEAGAIRGQRTRALNISAGLAGGDFASAAAERTEEDTRRIIEERGRERDATIAKVLADVEERTSEEFISQRDAFLSRAEGNLERIEAFQQNQRTRATTNIQNIAASGISYDEFRQKNPDALDQLLEESGLSEFELKFQFIAAMPKETKISEEKVGNSKVFFFQDPVTGKISSQTIELPEGEELGPQEDIVDDGFGNPFIVTYEGKVGESKITGTRTIKGIEQKTSTDDGGGTFTDTQSNKGAANAGVDAATFNSYDAVTKNTFINGDINGTKKDIDDIFSDKGTLEDANAAIDSIDTTDTVKDFLRTYAQGASEKATAEIEKGTPQAQVVSAVKQGKENNFSRKETKSQIMAKLTKTFGSKGDIPDAVKDALEDALVTTYGRTFLQKVIPTGR